MNRLKIRRCVINIICSIVYCALFGYICYLSVFQIYLYHAKYISEISDEKEINKLNSKYVSFPFAFKCNKLSELRSEIYCLKNGNETVYIKLCKCSNLQCATKAKRRCRCQSFSKNQWFSHPQYNPSDIILRFVFIFTRSFRVLRFCRRTLIRTRKDLAIQ